VVNPKKQFSAAQYQQKAISAIAEIVKRGKVPIICGGSGFHIDAITKNIVFPEVPPNKKLRDRLSQKSTILLFRELKRLNPARAKNIEEKNEQNNRVRLIRAIEIARKIGQVPKLENDTLSAGAESVSSKYKFVKIGLYLPRQILKKKIEKRLLKRIRLGMIQEAKNLHQKNLTWKRMKELGLEYRYLALYLQGKINKSEMIEKLKTEIYHYAKRQMTWFKRDKEIIWLDASKKLNLGKILAYSL
jgi:tRNA dimethylallyltransferase